MDSVTMEPNTTTAGNSTGENSTSLYEYSAMSDPPLEELVPVSIVYGLTLVFGMVGNVLVIFSVSKYKQMHTTTNTFLLSLASADLLLICICVPVKFAAFFSYMWRFGEFLCKSVHYIQNVSAICSVMTLTFMSLERYYAIVHPMKAKYLCTVGKARKACIILWILSFILAIPILIGRVQITVGLYRKATWCLKEWTNPIYDKIYEVYMFNVILVLPVTFMTFAYRSICRELWIMTGPRSTIRKEPTIRAKFGATPDSATIQVLKVKFATEDDNMRRQVIRMLVAIIIVFVICWAPITINNVLVAFKVLPKLHIGNIKYIREAFHVMSYANSCVNPLVYGFMSKNFRQTFKKSLSGCIRGKGYIRREIFRTQTESSFTYLAEGNYDQRWQSGAAYQVRKKGTLSSQPTYEEDLDEPEKYHRDGKKSLDL